MWPVSQRKQRKELHSLEWFWGLISMSGFYQRYQPVILSSRYLVPQKHRGNRSGTNTKTTWGQTVYNFESHQFCLKGIETTHGAFSMLPTMLWVCRCLCLSPSPPSLSFFIIMVFYSLAPQSEESRSNMDLEFLYLFSTWKSEVLTSLP